MEGPPQPALPLPDGAGGLGQAAAGPAPAAAGGPEAAAAAGPVAVAPLAVAPVAAPAAAQGPDRPAWKGLGIGVSHDHMSGCFKARIRLRWATPCLGRFNTPHEARLAYDYAAELAGKPERNYGPEALEGYVNPDIVQLVFMFNGPNNAAGVGADELGDP